MQGGDRRAYDSAYRFAHLHNGISYARFDYAVSNELALFDVPKAPYFFAVEQTLDRMIAALPAIKHVFAKPLIRLVDTQEIVPIEAVRMIDNHTLAHVAVHSELWENITEKGGIKPRKLMTVDKAETYAIYENIVFARTVDAMLKVTLTLSRMLQDVLYGCRDIQFNLLDRTHHSHYFYALGKLHRAYAQTEQRQYAVYVRCQRKLEMIEGTLKAYLVKPVYRQCKKQKQKITLKRTNIFRSHKDYKQIYLLYKWLLEQDGISQDEPLLQESHEEQEAQYGVYCMLLSLFAIGHFGFVFPEDATFDFRDFKAKCSFKKWRLTVRHVKQEGAEALVFTVKKEKEYTACLILNDRDALDDIRLEGFKHKVKAEEYLFASRRTYGESGVVYLSLYNVDSFRRIQQILLRAMIYADETRAVCPFCGDELEKTEEGYECAVCRAAIREKACPATGKHYFVSEINRYAPSLNRAEQDRRQRFLHDQYAEAQLHFRNITAITEDGKAICPHCEKSHETA